MFITKLALPRRTFLRGVGAAIALPLLDSMTPAMTALAKTAASPVKRLGFVYTPNGVGGFVVTTEYGGCEEVELEVQVDLDGEVRMVPVNDRYL